MKTLTTFPNHSEFEKAKNYLEKLSLIYDTIYPGTAYTRVGVPSIVIDQMVRSELYANEGDTFICSGWVDFHSTQAKIPNDSSRLFQKDLMGTCSIVVMTSCMAFALRLWSGEINPLFCKPIFEGEYGHLKDAFL